MRVFRALNLVFALPLATAWLVMPLLSAVGRPADGVMANVAVSSVAVVALAVANVEVDTDVVWKFSGAAFVVATAIHLLVGTGANSGEAPVPVVVGVWIVSVGVSASWVSRSR